MASLQTELSFPGRDLTAAGLRLSSLDPPTITVENPADPAAESRWCNDGFEPVRCAWLRFLYTYPGALGHWHRLRYCGTSAWVMQDPETGAFSIRSNGCNLRLCPRCKQHFQRRIHDKALALLTPLRANEWQVFEFTLLHTDAPLRDQLQRLRLCFRKLRQRKLWKSAIQFGYAVIEITFNEETRQWHPHMHVLARTDWIDWGPLRADWLSVTGDSNIINCSRVRSSRRAARYLAKYVGKMPSDFIYDDLELLEDWYLALQGARMLIRFGKHPPRTEPLPFPADSGLLFVARLSDMIRRATDRDPFAVRCMDALHEKRDAANAWFRRLNALGESPLTSDPDPPPF